MDPVSAPAAGSGSSGRPDPILEKRARIAHLCVLGKRIGYGLYLVAVIGFVIARLGEPKDWIVWLVGGALLVGSAFLLPAIIFGYAVGAAEREDRQRAAAKAAKQPPR